MIKRDYSSDLLDCIIVDVDGTVAIMGERSPYDWHRVGEDTVNEDVVTFLNGFLSGTKNLSRRVRVVIFTGRDGSCEKQTRDWLKDNAIFFDELYIRPEGNTEKDSIIKERLYKEKIEGRYNVLFVLDDRTQVVKMWRNLGLTCLQVADGDF